MTRDSAKKPELLSPSLLDRLIDHDPGAGEEPITLHGYGWRRYVEGIARDIQDLLNTRQTFKDEDLEGYPEARRSLLTYGLPEFEAISPEREQAQKMLKTALETTIKRFEPRLINVKIRYDQSEGRVAFFKIEAFVLAKPAPRRVLFDTRLDLDRAECMVQGES